MKKDPRKVVPVSNRNAIRSYDVILSAVIDLLESARRTSVRTINTIMTATYWEIGRRIVKYEQGGRGKADYGKKLIDRLAGDLTKKFGRGFGRSNLFQMRSFYLAYSTIVQTASGQLNKKNLAQIFQTSSEISTGMYHNLIRQTVSGESKDEFIGEPYLAALATRFQLPWSHYVKLLGVRTLMPVFSMRQKHYAADGVFGNWNGRFLHSSTSAPPFLKIRLLCSKKERNRSLKTPLRPKRK